MEQNNIKPEAVNLNEAVSLAGVHTAEAVARKLDLLSVADKGIIDDLLNKKGLPSLENMIGEKGYLNLLDVSQREQISSFVGDMRMHHDEQSKKEIAEKIAKILS